MSEQPRPNSSVDLQRIHRVVSRGLEVAQKNCAAFASGGFPDAVTAEGFWKYCLALEAIANGHHITEDDLFFPFLRERMPSTNFDQLAADHQVMHGILAEMHAAREAGSLAEMQAALAKMAELWFPHIEKEEADFSPEVAAEVMSIPETIDMAQKASALSQEHSQPAPLTIPFLLFNMEEEDRAQMIAVMPPEITQQLVPIVWKDEWAPMKPFLLD